MPIPLRCIDCGVVLTTQDALADQVVEDDEGFHHRECAGGDSPTRPVSAEEIAVAEREGDLTPKQVEEENERRREMGDPPLPDIDDYHRALTRTFPCEPFSVAGPRPDAIIWDDYPVIIEGRAIGEVAYRQTEGFDPLPVTDPLSRPRPDCPECGAEPSINGGRGLLCRGRSML